MRSLTIGMSRGTSPANRVVDVSPQGAAVLVLAIAGWTMLVLWVAPWVRDWIDRG